MNQTEKLQLLLFSTDLDTVRHGILLLDTLCNSIEEIYDFLEKNVPKSKQDWQKQSSSHYKKPLSQYLELWLLGKMAEYKIPWTLELKELVLYINPPDNIHHLQYIQQITILGDTVELSDLSSFVNIRELHIEGNMKINNVVLSDYSFLQQLEHLFVYSNDHLQKINVQNCSSLTNLYIVECVDLHEIIGLSELTDLQCLSITDLGPTNSVNSFDFSTLSSLTNLKELRIYGNDNFHDLTILQHMKKLEFLDLDRTGVSDLSPLLQLPHLKILNIIWCWLIKDLSPLYKHPSLQVLIAFEDGIIEKIPEEFAKLHQVRPDITIEEE